MAEPLLSVVVPVYNTEIYLKRCLDSILSQTYHNLEVIVVDDCSPDRSLQILDQYCKKDSRVVVARHEENKGLFQARLTGIGLATGEYIAFVDSDDYISIDYYRELVERAVTGDFDIVAGNTVLESAHREQALPIMHSICFDSAPLYGDEVRNAFYKQEGNFYAWHTVWNKIYKKTLWNKCLPKYMEVQKHLVMTEDIAFSCVLFYFARSFCHVSGNNVYFYCINKNAATDCKSKDIKKIKKNIADVVFVFRFVDNFLESVYATEENKAHFRNFRMRYFRNWGTVANRYGLDTHAEKLFEELGYGDEKTKSEMSFCFDQITTPWRAEIEAIKRRIMSEDIEIISFDIFDTLLLRPLWQPDDVFLFMQPEFEKRCPDMGGISFKEIRQLAETQARDVLYHDNPKFEDVTLDEIYREFKTITGISDDVARQIKELEEQTEYDLSRVRKTGRELFEFALVCGKRVILISDMYLNISKIRDMLEKNGYRGYERLFLSSDVRLLKSTGNLFDFALTSLHSVPGRILHIGDNLETDICMAERKGLRTAFLPKTRDSFCKTAVGHHGQSCASIGCLSGNYLMSEEKLYASLGYRSMAALVANRMFDNPYSSHAPSSFFNANPYIMGYYAVGMHMVGLCKWLADTIRAKNVHHICFLSRDGFLPNRTFEMMKEYYDVQDVTSSYVPCSRMLLMPWIIRNRSGLLSLPIVHGAHTPLSIARILTCCCKEMSETKLCDAMKNAGFIAGETFDSEREYFRFIHWFQDNLFDPELLENTKRATAEYYQSQIPKDSLVFDLGYSGNIPAALQECVQYHVVFAYVHHDNSKFYDNCRRSGMDFEVMYQFVPKFSDLIREYFLSELGNSCTALHREGGSILPVFEKKSIPYEERFTIEKIMEGACDFVHDFTETFLGARHVISFEPAQVSVPFEALIHASSDFDRGIMACSYSEDTVYGGQERINMKEFWISQPSIYHSTQHSVLSDKEHSKFIKVLIYAIYDRKSLKEKVRQRLRNHKALLFVSRKIYGTLRAVKNIFRRKA